MQLQIFYLGEIHMLTKFGNETTCRAQDSMEYDGTKESMSHTQGQASVAE